MTGIVSATQFCWLETSTAQLDQTCSLCWPREECIMVWGTLWPGTWASLTAASTLIHWWGTRRWSLTPEHIFTTLASAALSLLSTRWIINIQQHFLYLLTKVTTQHNDWVMVDFIFYSTIPAPNHAVSADGRREGKLKLLTRLSHPSAQQMSQFSTIPDKHCPSDHLPLIADFILKS